MPFEVKNIGAEKALQKIRHFCAYQERNHREVKEKLYSFGLYKTDVEALLSQMIEENYLNEERYAITFAGGKFRIKKWGKTKIKFELQQKKVSAYCIKKALSLIEEDEYKKTLNLLAQAKMKDLKSEKNIFIRKKKLQNYLVGKGYEFDLVNDVLRNNET